MIPEETPERLLKFLSTWPDLVLYKDHGSAFGGPCGNDLVVNYVKLRRKAPGWNHRRMGNSGKQLPSDAIPRLIADTQTAVEEHQKNLATCDVCYGSFVAKRSTARYCSTACRMAWNRAS